MGTNLKVNLSKHDNNCFGLNEIILFYIKYCTH